jgi:osmoprotectant transport system permease protein
MDAALMYQALAAAQVDVISAYTTEGKIRAYDLVILDDDIDAFPPYDAVILAAPGCDPDVLEALAALAHTLDDDAMLRANWSVDQEKRSPREVAAGLLPPGKR